MPLPDFYDLPIACDTEGSGLFADDGARISIVSAAWRDPVTRQVRSLVAPFDQGQGDLLPLGPKILSRTHANRLQRWTREHGPEILQAPNKPVESWRALTAWLACQRLIWHNAKHDLLQFSTGLRGAEQSTAIDLEPVTIGDTQLGQSVLEPTESTSLKPTAVRCHLGREFGIPLGGEAADEQALKPWKGPKTDPRYDLIPWQVIRPYATLDAKLTLILHEMQQTLLDAPEYEHLRVHLQRELALMRVLYRKELRGVGFDRQGCLAQAEQLRAMIEAATAKLPCRPTYPAAQKYFFGDPPEGQGHLPYDDKLTKTGRPQVDEESIVRLAREGVPGAAEFQQFAELKSAMDKWYGAWPALAGADGRLRPCHRQAHVVSGRLSVERWQAQAIPNDFQIPAGLRPIREYLIARKGCELWEVDVSQAEIRVATALAECSPMAVNLRRGIDSHDAACLLMFHQLLRDEEVPWDQMSARQQVERAKLHLDWDKYRHVAKRCNLGILYGAGEKIIQQTIAKEAGVVYPRTQVREWIQTWRRAFPPFVAALERASAVAAKHGYVRLYNGRVRMFSDFEPVHKAFNQEVQGSVAEAMKVAEIRVDHHHPGILLLQIHDSLVLEIGRERVQSIVTDVVQIVRSTFEQAFARRWQSGKRIRIPFPVDAKPFGRTALEYSSHGE